MVAHASRPLSPRPMPVQCGPRRYVDGYGQVHITGLDNYITTEPATHADFDGARWLTWWRSPAGRRFHGGRVNLACGHTLRVELAATLQGRFVILFAIRDAKGRILPGPSVVQSGQDPNEVFDGIIHGTSGDRLPTSWLS